MSRKTAIVGSCSVLVLVSLLVWMESRSKKTPPAEPQVSASSQSGQRPDALEQTLTGIVDRYRKNIVLLEEDQPLSESERDRVSIVGEIIFQENHQALSELSDRLTTEIENAGDFSKPLPDVNRFLDLIETQADLHDADKLGFREVFTDLAETLSGIKSTATAKTDLAGRVDTDRQALAEIQSLYEKELDRIFGRFDTRGMPVHREAWERYVAYLHTKYKRDDIVKLYATAISQVGQSGKKAELHHDTDLEIYGNNLPAKTFVLTFDDGPHPRYTDRILDVLQKHAVKSVFFELGTNLGRLKNNKVVQTQAATAARHLVQAGYTVGSHGFSHDVLPKMSDRQVAQEFDETNRMLETVVNVHPALFRPPYGDRDVKVLAAIDAHKMKSVLWNIDSEDWADPVAKSIANRVIKEARHLDHGIILLHDIHERTIDALPLIIETLQDEGYRFLSWNGKSFAEDPSAPLLTQISAPAADAAPVLYRESWAVIIGVDNYPEWPKLRYAVNDANGMKDILLQKFHFKPDHVITLLNEEATREKILSVLGDTLANPKNVQREDQVLIFFAGHGTTRKLPSGRDLGYIVPFDADTENFQGQAISMSSFQDISEAIPAKHVLFIMDSCYSGLALTRSGGSNNYIREISQRSARQILTAGGANEEVSDSGPNGHSVFSWTVLQGLEGRADLNSDGFISATELASYVGPTVSALARQTPAFGNLAGSEGGEFIFQLHPETEFLSELSTQLDQEAIQLNSEIDRIRRDIAAKSERNQQLRQQLAAVKSQQSGSTSSLPANATVAAAAHLNKGQTLFEEKRYDEALEEFLAAAKLNPSSALAANNAGFMYYKMGKLDEAILWTEKAVAIDPRRAVAYANLGDAYLQAKRLADARRVYQKYLEVAPNGPYAAVARSRSAG